MIPFKLDRPIAFFDIEATGTSPRADRIVELCILRIRPDHREDTLTYRINPGMPIPAEATVIHGIRDDDVRDCPSFKDVGRDILDFLEGCDLAGYNILRYDIPMLTEEFLRAELPFSVESRRLLDVQRIFHRREPRDLSAALQFYCGETHTDAHGAEADVRATLRVFEGQLTHYPDLPRSIEALDGYCNPQNPSWADRSGKLKWENGKIVINFGKNKGKALADLIEHDPGFIKWMLKSDFPPDTRDLIRNAQDGTWPLPPESIE